METNYTYKKITIRPDDEIILRSDNASIPCDLANADYQQYLAWLEEGNTPQEWKAE